ncbi:MAG: sulfotransferase domain-containing protein, partial [Bacteroidota bacterium]
EEYFFKVFLKDSFISDSTLEEHEVDEQTYENYLAYQKLICPKNKESTYLAKNNNLILRYKSLRSHNPDFKIVMIFRNPLAHAYSLLTQYNRFCDMHEADPFTLDYMNWLGHHEFGLNHKVFNLELIDTRNRYNTSSINYWIAIWISYYTHILSLKGDENLFLIEYTDLCLHPKELLHTLGKIVNLDLSVEQRDPYKERELSGLDIDPDLLKRSQSLFKKLKKLKVEIK